MRTAGIRFFGSWRLVCCMTLWGLSAWCLAPSAAWALDPDSLEVKAAIAKGIAHLETAKSEGRGLGALAALTMVKNGTEKTHAKIEQALQATKAATKAGSDAFNDDIYSTGMQILFLVALDPYKYREEIEVMVRSLHRRQKSDGAWGYPQEHALGKTCDTSMTQYAVLALWEASAQAAVATPPEVWDRVGQWLILTQAAEGGYGYQGNPSTSYDVRAKQEGVKHSMTAAGMGAFYIVKDQLGLGELKKAAVDETPDALRPFETPEEARARIKTAVEAKYFTRTQNTGDGWMNKNFTIDKPSGWLHYYLYALERYESLKEADSKKTAVNKTPRWYDLGAKFLVKTQSVDGSWEGQTKGTADTCFSLLFLLRSTKKSLEKSSVAKFEAGVLVGGRGLPEGADLRVREGKVVVKPLAGTPEELLVVLATPGHHEYPQAIEALADLASKGDPAILKTYSAQLGQLALTGDAEKRVAAIRALSRGRDMNQVPLLIHLLNDEHSDVMREARDALRAISRKFEGYGPGLRPTDEERSTAIDQWKKWYRSIRPDVDLESFEPITSLSAVP